MYAWALVVAAGLVVLLAVRGSRRPWLAVVKPPSHHRPAYRDVVRPKVSSQPLVVGANLGHEGIKGFDLVLF